MKKLEKKSLQVPNPETCLAILNGFQASRQTVLTMERALKRSLIALSPMAVHEDLCEDIKSILDFLEESQKQETKEGPESDLLAGLIS